MFLRKIPRQKKRAEAFAAKPALPLDAWLAAMTSGERGRDPVRASEFFATAAMTRESLDSRYCLSRELLVFLGRIHTISDSGAEQITVIMRSFKLAIVQLHKYLYYKKHLAAV